MLPQQGYSRDVLDPTLGLLFPRVRYTHSAVTWQDHWCMSFESTKSNIETEISIITSAISYFHFR